MATVTKIEDTVVGNLRMAIYTALSNEAAYTIQTGMYFVEAAHMEAQTATGGGAYAKVNEGISSTAIAGNVSVKSSVTGGQYILTVYGR
jgi:hypothetical protein